MFNDLAISIITNMITANLPKIQVKSGSCRYNFRCHNNAVHDALNAGNEKIAMAFYFDEQPIIHFLNVENDGTFVDNTLGRWSEIHSYHLIRYIGKEDFFNVVKIFSAYRKEIRRMLPWWLRFLVTIDF